MIAATVTGYEMRAIIPPVAGFFTSVEGEKPVVVVEVEHIPVYGITDA